MSEEKSSLFGLVGEYKELYALLTDTDEEDRQVVETSLETVEFEIQQKAEGYLAIMERLDMELDAAEKHKKYWTDAVNSRKKGKEWMKQHIIEAMIQMGVDEIQAGDKKFKLSNAGGVQPIVYDSSKVVPERFTKLIIETDGQLVREALNNGEELDFAHFAPRSKVLKIK